MIRYARELVADLWEEAMPLLERHWREVAYCQGAPLDPDREAYALLESSGRLRCYTARAGERLVGYAVFVVCTSLNSRTLRLAEQAVLYLLPEYRAAHGGYLIRHTEQELAAEGVQVIYHHAKRTNRAGELLERLGYDLDAGIYAKRLDVGGHRHG